MAPDLWVAPGRFAQESVRHLHSRGQCRTNLSFVICPFWTNYPGTNLSFVQQICSTNNKFTDESPKNISQIFNHLDDVEQNEDARCIVKYLCFMQGILMFLKTFCSTFLFLFNVFVQQICLMFNICYLFHFFVRTKTNLVVKWNKIVGQICFCSIE